MQRFLTLLFPLFLCTCGPAQTAPEIPQETPPEIDSEIVQQPTGWLNQSGVTIATRIRPPAGFERAEVADNTFGSYLREQEVRPPGSPVLLFDGSRKPNQRAHVAVLNIDVEPRDLQQCADAIMRLRAEYLLKTERYADIHFNFSNGFRAEYLRWRRGERIRVQGNKVSWVPGTADGSYAAFRKYLTMVFAYAGTASLVHELEPKPLAETAIGDVFIKGGSPGHAVIVVDKVIHNTTGEVAVLLAQSYMPAQDIHVLVNPANEDGSPWYFISDFKKEVRTAEYTFAPNALRNWRNE